MFEKILKRNGLAFEFDSVCSSYKYWNEDNISLHLSMTNIIQNLKHLFTIKVALVKLKDVSFLTIMLLGLAKTVSDVIRNQHS